MSSLAPLEAFAVNDYFTDAKITPVVRRLSRGKIVFLYYFVQPDNTGNVDLLLFYCFLALTVRSLWFCLTPKQLPCCRAMEYGSGANKFARKRPQARYLSIKELCFKRKFRPKPEDLSIAQRTNASGYFRGTF